MSDGDPGYVSVQPDGTGKKVETSELTRPDGTIVERQRIALGDGTEFFFAQVDAKGRIAVMLDQTEVLLELRRIALLLEVLTGTKCSASDVR